MYIKIKLVLTTEKQTIANKFQMMIITTLKGIQYVHISNDVNLFNLEHLFDSFF